MTRSRKRLVRVLAVVAGVVLTGVLAAHFWRQYQVRNGYFHIYVLGGSSAWGEPYAPHVDDVLGRIVAMHFGDRIAGKPVRVVTLAEAGTDLTRVTERADAIVKQDHLAGSAIALVYAGHNEFIDEDDHRNLRDNPRRLLDEPVVPAAKRTQMMVTYREKLGELTDKLRSAGVPVIFSTVAGNIRDWDPNRSMVAELSHGPQVTSFFAQGTKAFEQRDFNSATNAFGQLLAFEPGFAHAHFYLGQCFLLTGETAGAKAHLLAAADFDANPTRVTSEQNAAIAEHCASAGVPFVDSWRRLQAASPDGIVGFNLIWDNVHPRLEAFLIIGQGFAEKVSGLTGTPMVRTDLERVEVERSFQIDRTMLGHIFAGRGQTCYGHATRTWSMDLRLRQAELYFGKALEIHPRDADLICSIAVMQLMRGETDQSLATWRRAWALDSEIATRRLGNLHVRQLFRRQGIEDAEARVKP